MKFKSKTATMSHYDEVEPVRTFLILRAWMCYRATWGDWAQRKSARKRWLADETESLRADIRALGVCADGSGSTGNAAADARIKEWWPAALAPAPA